MKDILVVIRRQPLLIDHESGLPYVRKKKPRPTYGLNGCSSLHRYGKIDVFSTAVMFLLSRYASGYSYRQRVYIPQDKEHPNASAAFTITAPDPHQFQHTHRFLFRIVVACFWLAAEER